jgi:hypothetical protein
MIELWALIRTAISWNFILSGMGTYYLMKAETLKWHNSKKMKVTLRCRKIRTNAFPNFHTPPLWQSFLKVQKVLKVIMLNGITYLQKVHAVSNIVHNIQNIVFVVQYFLLYFPCLLHLGPSGYIFQIVKVSSIFDGKIVLSQFFCSWLYVVFCYLWSTIKKY